MGILATDAEEQARLAHMIAKEGHDEMRGMIHDFKMYADVMRDFPSAHMPLEYILNFVPNITLRLYSIASASEKPPSSIIVEYMMEQGKEEAFKDIDNIASSGRTIIWGGLHAGLECLRGVGQDATSPSFGRRKTPE